MPTLPKSMLNAFSDFCDMLQAAPGPSRELDQEFMGICERFKYLEWERRSDYWISRGATHRTTPEGNVAPEWTLDTSRALSLIPAIDYYWDVKRKDDITYVLLILPSKQKFLGKHPVQAMAILGLAIEVNIYLMMNPDEIPVMPTHDAVHHEQPKEGQDAQILQFPTGG